MPGLSPGSPTPGYAAAGRLYSCKDNERRRIVVDAKEKFCGTLDPCPMLRAGPLQLGLGLQGIRRPWA